MTSQALDLSILSCYTRTDKVRGRGTQDPGQAKHGSSATSVKDVH